MPRLLLPPPEEIAVTQRKNLRRVTTLINGKWKLEILWVLNRGTHRFNALRRAIPGVTQHMLTAQLRELEADGLVQRRIYDEVPPHVDYTITPRALSLKPVFEALFAWEGQAQAIAPKDD